MPALVDWRQLSQPYETYADNWPASLTVTYGLNGADLGDVYALWLMVGNDNTGSVTNVASWGLSSEWTLVQYRVGGSSSGGASLWCYTAIAGSVTFPFTLTPLTSAGAPAVPTSNFRNWSGVLTAFDGTEKIDDGYFYYTTSGSNVPRLQTQLNSPYSFPVGQDETVIACGAIDNDFSDTSLTQRTVSGYTDRIRLPGIIDRDFNDPILRDGTIYARGIVDHRKYGIRTFDAETLVEGQSISTSLGSFVSTFGVPGTKFITGTDGMLHSYQYASGTAVLGISAIDPVTMTEIRTVTFPSLGNPYAFAEGFGSYWVHDTYSSGGASISQVRRINKITGLQEAVINTISYGSNNGPRPCTFMLATNNKVYLNLVGGIITIDPTTNTIDSPPVANWFPSPQTNAEYIVNVGTHLYVTGFRKIVDLGTGQYQPNSLFLNGTFDAFYAREQSTPPMTSLSPSGNVVWASITHLDTDGVFGGARSAFVQVDLSDKEFPSPVMAHTVYAISGVNDVTTTTSPYVGIVARADNKLDLFSTDTSSNPLVATGQIETNPISPPIAFSEISSTTSYNYNVGSVGYIESNIYGNSIWVGGSSLTRLDPATLTSTLFVPVNTTQPSGTSQKSLTVADMAFDAATGSLWFLDSLNNAIKKLDLATETVTATVSVSTNPTSVTNAGGAIWVTHGSSSDLLRINPSTNTVVATITLGDSSNNNQSISAGGFVWVANTTTGRISKVSPNTNSIVGTTVPVPYVTGLGYDGTKIWFAARGSNTSTTASNRAIWTLNMSSLTATQQTTNSFLPSIPTGMFWDGTHMWVGCSNQSNPTSSVVVRVNSSYAITSTVTGIGGAPSDITHMLGKVYTVVSPFPDAQISQIDTTTSTITNSADLDSNFASFASIDSTVFGGWVWHLRRAARLIQLVKIDPASGATVSITNISTKGFAKLIGGGGEIWVVTSDNSPSAVPNGLEIVRVSVNTGAVTRFPYTLPRSPSSLAWAGGSLWILSLDGGTSSTVRSELHRINPNTGATTKIQIVSDQMVADTNSALAIAYGLGYLWVLHNSRVTAVGQQTTHALYKYSIASGSYQTESGAVVNGAYSSYNYNRTFMLDLVCGSTHVFISETYPGATGVAYTRYGVYAYNPGTGVRQQLQTSEARPRSPVFETATDIYADAASLGSSAICRYDKNRPSGRIKCTHVLYVPWNDGYLPRTIGRIIVDGNWLYAFTEYLTGGGGRFDVVYRRWDLSQIQFTSITAGTPVAIGKQQPEFSLIEREYITTGPPTALPEFNAGIRSTGIAIQVAGETGNDPVFGYFTG